MMAVPRYVVITPVRDEEKFVGKMVASMLAQSLPPVRWVIVDDGSMDRTKEIVSTQIGQCEWAMLIETGSEKRNLGTGEVLAFQRGLAAIADEQYEFLVKLDADVLLEQDYFARVLERMSGDPEWGIGSGIHWEEQGGEWRPVSLPSYHVPGASKVVRRRCYEEIGGFVPAKGWDTLDEVRARMRGWKTGHFLDIRFHHLKPEGSVMGTLATHRFHGEIYYRTGGGLIFLVPKVLHRMCCGQPRIVGGFCLLQGYLAASMSGNGRLFSHEEARFYRRMLSERFRDVVTPTLAFREYFSRGIIHVRHLWSFATRRFARRS